MSSMQKINIWVHKNKKSLFASVSIVAVVSTLPFVVPQSMKLSFDKPTCADRYIFLPGLYRSVGGAFRTEYKNTLSIGQAPLLSSKICVSPIMAPKGGVSSAGMALFGWSFLQHRLSIRIGELPSIGVEPLRKPIAFFRPLTLPMDTTDTLFEYQLTLNNTTIRCKNGEQILECPVAAAGIQPSHEYAYTITRNFNGSPLEVMHKGGLRTLDAVQVGEVSIAPGSTVYSIPRSFAVTFNKDIVQAQAKLDKVVGDKHVSVKVNQVIDGKGLTLSWDGDLDREAAYEVRISNVEASDGSSLGELYSNQFTVAGGPKIANVSVGKTGVALGATITVTFDQELSATQDIGKIATLSGGTARITKGTNYINYTLQSIGQCADFTIAMGAGMLSKYDIASSASWSYGSRTICHSTSIYGYSVRGRALMAYTFGTSGPATMYVGAIHGNELSSKYLTDALVAYLEEHAREIPSDRRVVVVPTVNPDGVAAKTRYNARNVNLNRNFPTTNWVSDTAVSGGTVEQGAGGSSSLSEPEAAALAAFTQSLQPRLVVTYHSQGSLVNSNDVGIAATLGPQYATMTRYKFVSSEATTGVFGFEMTGTYEDWLAERSTPAILIELPTNTGGYFSQNAAAIWAMIRG